MNVHKAGLFFLVLFSHIFFGCFLSVYSHPKDFRYRNTNYILDSGYVYRFQDSEIKIIEMNDCENMNIKSVICEDGIENCNIHVSKNNLLVSGIKVEGDERFLVISIYDVYDKENPVKVNEFEISGDYYIFKNKGSCVYLTVYKEGKSKIISLDLERSKVHLKTQEFLSESPEFVYVSCDDLYIVSRHKTQDVELSTIYKFHRDLDVLTYVDKVSLEGEIINEDFINEYIDNLRVLVRENTGDNSLYIFNEELTLLNSVKGFFGNKDINSIYFHENMCYLSSFSKNGYFGSYDLKNLSEVNKMEIPISVNHILRLDENRILLIGSENKFDTYKNIYTHNVYELMKNLGLKILTLENIKGKDIKILDEYLIKGKHVYSPCFMDKSQIIYLEDERELILPVDITDYNMDVDMSSAMEVSSNFYRNIFTNFRKVFSGIYIFNFKNQEDITLRTTIDNYKDLNCLEHEYIHYMEIYKNNIFIFTKDFVKVFDLNGCFLGMKEI